MESEWVFMLTSLLLLASLLLLISLLLLVFPPVLASLRLVLFVLPAGPAGPADDVFFIAVVFFLDSLLWL